MLDCHDFHGNPLKRAVSGHYVIAPKGIFAHPEDGIHYKNQYK